MRIWHWILILELVIWVAFPFLIGYEIRNEWLQTIRYQSYVYSPLIVAVCTYKLMDNRVVSLSLLVLIVLLALFYVPYSIGLYIQNASDLRKDDQYFRFKNGDSVYLYHNEEYWNIKLIKPHGPFLCKAKTQQVPLLNYPRIEELPDGKRLVSICSDVNVTNVYHLDEFINSPEPLAAPHKRLVAH